MKKMIVSAMMIMGHDDNGSHVFNDNSKRPD